MFFERDAIERDALGTDDVGALDDDVAEATRRRVLKADARDGDEGTAGDGPGRGFQREHRRVRPIRELDVRGGIIHEVIGDVDSRRSETSRGAHAPRAIFAHSPRGDWRDRAESAREEPRAVRVVGLDRHRRAAPDGTLGGIRAASSAGASYANAAPLAVNV